MFTGFLAVFKPVIRCLSCVPDFFSAHFSVSGMEGGRRQGLLTIFYIHVIIKIYKSLLFFFIRIIFVFGCLVKAG